MTDKELVGSIWERTGRQRQVTRIVDNLVYWKQPEGLERRIPQHKKYFLKWTEKALRIL